MPICNADDLHKKCFTSPLSPLEGKVHSAYVIGQDPTGKFCEYGAVHDIATLLEQVQTQEKHKHWKPMTEDLMEMISEIDQLTVFLEDKVRHSAAEHPISLMACVYQAKAASQAIEILRLALLSNPS